MIDAEAPLEPIADVAGFVGYFDGDLMDAICQVERRQAKSPFVDLGMLGDVVVVEEDPGRGNIYARTLLLKASRDG